MNMSGDNYLSAIKLLCREREPEEPTIFSSQLRGREMHPPKEYSWVEVTKATQIESETLDRMHLASAHATKCLVNRFGLAVRREAGKQKDVASIPLRLSFFFKSSGLWTLSLGPVSYTHLTLPTIRSV